MIEWVRVLGAGCIALAMGGCSLVPGSVNSALGNTIRITADFESGAGVFEGDEVDVLGTPVGRVEKVVPKPTFAEVHLSIDRNVKIAHDVVAAIVSPSVVTDRHIELTPAYTGGETLAAGTHLPTARTRTPVEIDALIKTIDQFAAALKPEPGTEVGVLSGRVLYPMLNGNGAKLRDTLNALSGALKVGVDNKDAVATIIVQLNELTTVLAENDESVRDFSNRTTQLSGLLADQAPGLQATLEQIDGFLVNTSSLLSKYQDRLIDTVHRLTEVTDQLRANAFGVTEIVDVAPMLLQSIDRSMNRQYGYIRLHALLGTALSGEQIAVICQRLQMRADGCRTGRVADLGPDFGITAALLGLTK
ncbi:MULTISPECIES: MCE family protein [unclassified Nocardia]|uniref:MCE family protein n=1 Tax=unclassified Nocardia TaxID=2637762 RepID=UPI001CE43068|nr:MULTISPECIES: MlaD family protein [unclassified Nocardia]